MKFWIFFIPLFLVIGIVESQGQNLIDSISAELSNHFEHSDLPGFAVAIINENGVLYQQGFGYANLKDKTSNEPSTIQNLGSVSKTVVGLALIKAIEERKINLDTKINDVLPFEVVNPYYQETPILVRHLVTHTSSILDTKHYGKSYVLEKGFNNNGDIHEDYLEFLKGHEKIELQEFLFRILNHEGNWYGKKNFLRSRPGTEQEYSNLNAALAAIIIEIATGIPFAEYTKQHIFIPLGMESTSWSYADLDQEKFATPYFPVGKIVPRYSLITYPDGGLFSSVSDLSLYLQEIIKAYSGNSEYLTSQFTHLLLPGDDDQNRAFWGMGEKSRNIGHGGSDPGVQTDLQFNADRKVGRIIFANVNAEDNEKLWEQYRGIHDIIAKYEDRLNQ